MRRLVTLALIVAAAGCSGKNPITGSGTVIYRVTGTAARADLTYENASGGTSQTANATLPWTYNRPSKTGDFLYISAQNAGSTGCVTVEIVSGNNTLEHSTSCGAFVIATASRTY